MFLVYSHVVSKVSRVDLLDSLCEHLSDHSGECQQVGAVPTTSRICKFMHLQPGRFQLAPTPGYANSQHVSENVAGGTLDLMSQFLAPFGALFETEHCFCKCERYRCQSNLSFCIYFSVQEASCLEPAACKGDIFRTNQMKY